MNEGIPNRVRPLATVRQRVVAYLVDFGFVGAGLVVATRGERSRVRRAPSVVTGAVVLATLYHVLLEGFTGRTAGKTILGIAVVGEDGSPCTVRAAAVRTLGRFVDWLPVAYLLGFLSIAVTGRRQRVGDLVASTVVVRTRGKR